MGRNSNGTGYIRRRTNGLWEGQYLFKGNRKSIYGADYNAVRSRLNQIYADIINSAHSEVSITSLGEWLAFWLENYSKPVVRHSTFISYETYIAVISFRKSEQSSLRHCLLTSSRSSLTKSPAVVDWISRVADCRQRQFETYGICCTWLSIRPFPTSCCRRIS